MGNNLSPSNACWVGYIRATNQMYLFKEPGFGVAGPLTPGAAGTLVNNQCRIDGASSSVSTSGNHLILNVGVSSRVGGTWNAWVLAVDNAAEYSGWQQRATLTLPVVP